MGAVPGKTGPHPEGACVIFFFFFGRSYPLLFLRAQLPSALYMGAVTLCSFLFFFNQIMAKDELLYVLNEFTMSV